MGVNKAGSYRRPFTGGRRTDPMPDEPVGSTAPEEETPQRGALLERLLLRLIAIAIGSQLLLRLPLPIFDDWLPLRDVLVVIGAVILAGRALYDTLFFDRFWPHAASGRKPRRRP